ncbi:MAG: EpsI family protein [Armatimonadota bacterium]|nr:EpsI family protein [Armatimonadota bacterium]
MPHIRRVGYLLTLLIGAALATAMVWKPAPPPRFAGISGQDVPRALDSYRCAADDAVPADVKAALSSADLLSRTYTENGAMPGDAINFVLIGGTDRSALHDPRSCLIGSGMQIENDHLERLPGTNVDVRVCHAVGTNGAGGLDILYLYVVNGKVVSQATQIRAAMLWSALLGRRGTPVYFLRFTRGLAADPNASVQEHDSLQRFASKMWITLQPKLRPAAE